MTQCSTETTTASGGRFGSIYLLSTFQNCADPPPLQNKPCILNVYKEEIHCCTWHVVESAYFLNSYDITTLSAVSKFQVAVNPYCINAQDFMPLFLKLLHFNRVLPPPHNQYLSVWLVLPPPKSHAFQNSTKIFCPTENWFFSLCNCRKC
jgi:hypothetical protein